MHWYSGACVVVVAGDDVVSALPVVDAGAVVVVGKQPSSSGPWAAVLLSGQQPHGDPQYAPGLIEDGTVWYKKRSTAHRVSNQPQVRALAFTPKGSFDSPMHVLLS